MLRDCVDRKHQGESDVSVARGCGVSYLVSSGLWPSTGVVFPCGESVNPASPSPWSPNCHGFAWFSLSAAGTWAESFALACTWGSGLRGSGLQGSPRLGLFTPGLQLNTKTWASVMSLTGLRY